MPARPPAPAPPPEAAVPLTELIDGLRAPGALEPGAAAECVQTHISVVFLTPRYAWKLKKPLRLWGLVDYGTLAARRHWCEEEVRVNRRLAPDLYLGVREVRRGLGGRIGLTGAGEVVAHLVQMQRIAPGATWSERLDAGVLEAAEVRAGAERIAAFHGAVRLPEGGRALARPAGFARVLRQNFRGTAEHVPARFPPRVHAGLATRLARRLRAARGRLAARVAEGRAVDGHGDLRLDHVLRHQGRLVVIDAVEFTARLRHVDPLSDLAFLAVDLVARGRPDLARVLEEAYLQHAPDPDAAALLPLFRAYRAHVRAKVSAVTAAAAEVPAAQRAANDRAARRWLATAWGQARLGAPGVLLVLRGLSGTGKSTLASRLAPWLGARIVRSDLVRKDLLGLAPTARPQGAAREAAYSEEMGRRTYAELLRRGLAHARAGASVILDATYLRADSRAEVQAAAQRAGLAHVLLDVTCAPQVVRERIAARAARDDDASDADWKVYLEQAATQEPLTPAERTQAVPFASEEPAEAGVLSLLDRIEAQVDARTEPLGEEVDPWT